MTVRERNVSIDIAKSICMFLIMMGHLIGQTNIKTINNYGEAFIYNYMIVFLRVACSVYLMITAWYSCESGELKFKKFLNIWLTFVFWEVPIVLYEIHSGYAGKRDLYFALLPISGGLLWFVGHYMILLLIQPILYSVIRGVGRETFKKGLIIASIFVVVEPSLTLRPGILGSDFVYILFVYFLIAYVKKHGNFFSMKLSIILLVTISLLMCLGRAFADINSSRFPFLSQKIITYFDGYVILMRSLPNLLMAFSIFSIFIQLKIHKWPSLFSTLSSTTLGIYCIHQCINCHQFYWEDVMHVSYFLNRFNGIQRICFAIAITVFGFCLCSSIELARIRLMEKLVYKSSIYRTICNKINQYLQR